MQTERRTRSARATVAFVFFLAGQALFYGSAFLPVVPWSWQDAEGIAPGFLAAWFSMALSFFPTFLGVILMILAPVLFWAHSVLGVKWLGVVYLPFALNVWPFGITLPDPGTDWEYYSGYWTWCASVTLVTVAFFVAPRGRGSIGNPEPRFHLGLTNSSSEDVA